MNNKIIFDRVRPWLDSKGFTPERIAALDDAILDALGGDTIVVVGKPAEPTPVATGRQLGEAGAALIHNFESCAKKRPDGRFEAYPDPGSKDGHPWTIGWGSTGEGIEPGTIWTQAECDARFARDIVKYAAQVSKAIGNAPTTQNQFDAMVSFHYNTGRIFSATLTKKHIKGDYLGAAAEFGKWVYNDGQVLRGLVRRRGDEAALYGKPC